ncbi:hypothetical protein AVEN_232462-1 [Araneus ventricosus]|uniref:Uncharacterized protein n=1 Tax=Araneus ventricosus TaxID=182803 RepID=A0A4Y2EBU0_ARAVE|nr:hypothetical protein AVEN_232462-1 [Araneus ventricosus]
MRKKESKERNKKMNGSNYIEPKTERRTLRGASPAMREIEDVEEPAAFKWKMTCHLCSSGRGVKKGAPTTKGGKRGPMFAPVYPRRRRLTLSFNPKP